MIGAALPQRGLIRLRVIVPTLALLEIRQGELPVPGRIPDARLESFPLFIAADVEEELQNGDAAFGEHLLEVVNLSIALLPHLFGDQVMNASDQNILVVGAV